MFSGLVETVGRILSIKRCPDTQECLFDIDCHLDRMFLDGTELGDSISCDGVCLTVKSLTARQFTVGVSPETLRRTSFGLKAKQLPTIESADDLTGNMINLERSLRVSDRIGGHFVQGHVDTAVQILAIDWEQESMWLTLSLPRDYLKYVVEKGYVALDGISLTVCQVSQPSRQSEGGWFKVMLVKYTQEHVGISKKYVGDLVNLEVDILGKYVERQLQCVSLSSQLAAVSLPAAVGN